MFTVYTITLRGSDDCYVGMTGATTEHRWGQHRSNARGTVRSPIADALRAHGFDAFDWEVLAEFPDQASAELEERAQISQRQSTFNVLPGGRSGYHMPPSVRAKQSAAALARPAPSLETREKIATSKRGQKVSAETRAKMSAARMGRPGTSKVGRAPTKGRTGMPHTEETKAKMSAARRAYYERLRQEMAA